ncbi:MAG TPA: pitrilysin family protein [Sandaracinaceae bacterium LLY-WYZ-13_1]|nr:pitrilysin family protein [Sandaracinaceae bacterium LLY-WYZ-13_1]
MSRFAGGSPVAGGIAPPPVGPTLERTLPNGLRVAVAELPHLRSATVTVAFAVGSRYEDAREQGLSHFLEHALHRGTPTYPSSHALNRAIEALGGDLLAGTCADVTTYAVTLPPPSVPAVLDVLREVFTAPRLGELTLEKRIVREEILEGQDGDGHCVDPDDLSRRLLWGPDHPLGRSILGTLASLERFEAADLRAHLARAYGAANAVLAVAGPVSADAVFEAVEATLGRLPRGRRLTPAPAPPPTQGPVTSHVEESGSQTTVRVCFPAFGDADPRSSALALLARLLDDGMSARLHRRLIDEAGLAYEAWAGLDLHADCGVFDASGTCAHRSAPALLRTLLSTLAGLRAPVEPAELELARRRALWSLEASLDDAAEVAEHAAVATLFGLPRELDELKALLREVTPRDVAAVARAVFVPAGLHVVTVGVLDRRGREEVDAIARRWHPGD